MKIGEISLKTKKPHATPQGNHMGFVKDLYAYEGLLDSHFMGNLKIKIYNFGKEDYSIKKGDKYCQGVLKKKINHHFEEIDEQTFLEAEKRARGYWGSTGK
jgi:dUTP pyrophosphatase